MIEELKQRLSEHFPDSDIAVQGDGRHFDLQIVSPAFEGVRSVKRQQMVYAAINDWIRDGKLHAVNIKAMAPSEH